MSRAITYSFVVPGYSLQSVSNNQSLVKPQVRVLLKYPHGAVTEGKNIILKCNVHGFLHFHIEWIVRYHQEAPSTRNNTAVYPFGYHSEYMIVNSTKWNSGEYICTAYDAKSNQHESGSLVLRVQGKFSRLQAVIRTLVLDTASVRCHFSCRVSYPHPPSVQFYGDRGKSHCSPLRWDKLSPVNVDIRG